MNQQLISIIIPIYNAEKYLKELFDSIDRQTYNNYEVILINDGSTDNSEKICIDYSNSNNKVKYFKKENTGVSDTRNYGIERCSGKYICFIDADDTLDKTYLEDFSNIVIKENVELVCCDFYKFSCVEDLTKKVTVENKTKTKYVNNEKYDVMYSKYCGYLWNKIFLKDIIIKNDIKFDSTIAMMEDMLFLIRYLKFINTVICIDKQNYNYRQITGSASKNLSNPKWFSIFKTLSVLNENKSLFSKNTLNRFSYSYIYYIYEAKYRLKYMEDSKKYEECKKIVSESKKEYKTLQKNLTLTQKAKLSIFKYFNKIAIGYKKRR
jgi:glycosyltransferase involved in cell wall biosynthesis